MPLGRFFNQPDEYEQDDRPDSPTGNLVENGRTEYIEIAKQETEDQRAEDANNDVANQPKSVTLHDLACEEAGNRTYQQSDEQSSHIHH